MFRSSVVEAESAMLPETTDGFAFEMISRVLLHYFFSTTEVIITLRLSKRTVYSSRISETKSTLLTNVCTRRPGEQYGRSSRAILDQTRALTKNADTQR